MKRFALSLLCLASLLLSAGCGHIPFIKYGKTRIEAPKDAGKPATFATATDSKGIVLPTGTAVKVTETAPQAAVEATTTTPAIEAKPAQKITEFVLTAPAEWRETAERVNAQTGTVDTSVALKKVDAAESRPLLYAALAAAVAAGFFVWAKYPTPALACGIASAVFFMAWKVSGMPEWFWAVGAIGLAIAGALYIGHERGEKNAFTAPVDPPLVLK